MNRVTIDLMQERRCEYCGRKLHPKLRKDARFCERTCKSNWHRWKKEHPDPPPGPDDWFDRIPDEWKGFAYAIFGFVPPGATGYLLRRIDCPHGNGIFLFPVPNRVTKHSDNTLRDTQFYRLSPFEAPRVPWPGDYEVWFWGSEHGVTAPAGQTPRHVSVNRAVPRAAWDEYGLWTFYPPKDGSTTGSSSDVEAQIRQRAPKDAVGYLLRIDSSPHGPGSFGFPVEGSVSRRTDGAISDLPYFRLNPYEPPMVPWPGTYTLYFALPHMPFWADPDPQRRLLYVGHVYPHADFNRRERAPIIVITDADQLAAKHSRGPTRLLAGRRGLRRLPRR